MSASIDHTGGVTIPTSIREAAGLQPGTRVRFRLVGGGVLIEPELESMVMERSGRMAVAVAPEETPVLTSSEVVETLDAVRNRSVRAILDG